MATSRVKWKLYYDDFSTFCDEDGEWEDAPYRGALILATSDSDVGRELDHGERGQFFAWWPGASKPWGFDNVGILDYMVAAGVSDERTLLPYFTLQDFDDANVKVGRSVDNDVFRDVLQNAVEDDYLEPKTAWTPRESA